MQSSNTEKITTLFGIKYPIIQAGMVWASGSKLAAASANAGILGIIGAGSMKPPLLEEHLKKVKTLTTGSVALNIPLLYKDAKEQIDLGLKYGINFFFTSAGSPKKYTSYLKDQGATVVHVTSSVDQALKCEAAGVDAIVSEGFEAGGHNGIHETTSMVLLPQVADAVKIPVIAAGGIASGRQILASFALGASAAQIGSLFVCAKESSAHPHFKNKIMNSKLGDTRLLMKSHVPVRLLENQFSKDVIELEKKGASKEELVKLLGKGRAKAGMFDGDIEQGELEIGQVASMIKEELSVSEIVSKLVVEYELAKKSI